MKKLEMEKIILVGVICASSFIVSLIALYYIQSSINLPDPLQVGIDVFRELLTIPAMIFIVAAFLFGVFKLLKKRFNKRVFAITTLSLISLLLIVFNWF